MAVTKTCCDSASLLKYSQSDADGIRQSVARLNGDYRSFMQLVAQLNATLYDLALLQELPWMSFIADSPQTRAVGDFLGLLRKEVLNQEIFFNPVENNPAELYEQLSTQCWNKMIQVRNAALCSICSGSSSSYFSESRANIDQQACDNVIGDCFRFFKRTNRYFINLVKFDSLVNLIKTKAGDIIEFEGLEQIDIRKAAELRKELGTHESEGKVDRLYSSVKDKEQRMAKKCCERFLSIHGDPWVEILDDSICNDKPFRVELMPLGKKLVKAAHEILTKAEIENQKKAIGLAAWQEYLESERLKLQYETRSHGAITEAPSRSLFKLGHRRRGADCSPVFEADVLVLPWRSSDDVTSVVEHCDHRRPMNMSLHLP